MSHFRAEIAEQPEVASRLLAQGADAAMSIGERIREVAPHGFVIAARGSSDNAALYAKYLFGVRNQPKEAILLQRDRAQQNHFPLSTRKAPKK